MGAKAHACTVWHEQVHAVHATMALTVFEQPSYIQLAKMILG